MKISGSVLLLAVAFSTLMLAGSLPARADATQQLNNAISEAQAALSDGDIDGVHLHLRQSANCLVGRDSGYYYAPDGDGGPCTDRASVVGQLTDALAKQWVTQAVNLLLGGGAQSEVLGAHDHAEDGLKLLQKALARSGGGAAAPAAGGNGAAAPAPAPAQ